MVGAGGLVCGLPGGLWPASEGSRTLALSFQSSWAALLLPLVHCFSQSVAGAGQLIVPLGSLVMRVLFAFPWQNYEHLFKVNDKSVGGSFYLQSKVSWGGGTVLVPPPPRKPQETAPSPHT